MNRITKKRIWIMLLGISLIIINSGCGKSDKKKELESDYKIYYIDSSETKLVTEEYMPVASQREEMVKEFLEALKSDPKSFSYKKVIPDAVKIKDYKISKNNQLTLDFNTSYSDLDGITEILCRTAIVKTLCQIKGIDYVEFYVNGQPKMDLNDNPITPMRDEDFIDNTGGETNYYQNALITLYFANEKGNKLVESRHLFKYDGTISMEQLILDNLIKGPRYKEDGRKTIPKGTKLIKATTKNNVCYVDFNEKIMEKLPDLKDEVAIYSIVNSMIELPNVNKVQFLVNGGSVKRYNEITKFDQPFERKLELIEEK